MILWEVFGSFGGHVWDMFGAFCGGFWALGFFSNKSRNLRWRRMIRNNIFWYQSLDMSCFWIKTKDSRYIQLAIYTAVHAESESAVRIDKFLHSEEKIKNIRPMRVSNSYRNISYYMSQP